MKVSRDVPTFGRETIMLLTAESFEEERILNMLEKVVRRGGILDMEVDEVGMTARFDAKDLDKPSTS